MIENVYWSKYIIVYLVFRIFWKHNSISALCKNNFTELFFYLIKIASTKYYTQKE